MLIREKKILENIQNHKNLSQKLSFPLTNILFINEPTKNFQSPYLHIDEPSSLINNTSTNKGEHIVLHDNINRDYESIEKRKSYIIGFDMYR